MLETTRLDGLSNAIELDFVERVATPKRVMELGIHLHLAGLSLSNTQ
jgi:putative transposase